MDTGNGPSNEDRIQVDIVEEIVPPSVEHPDGLMVAEWRLAKVEPVNAPAAPRSAPAAAPPAPTPSAQPPGAQR
jgi:hypothetical protein